MSKSSRIPALAALATIAVTTILPAAGFSSVSAMNGLVLPGQARLDPGQHGRITLLDDTAPDPCADPTSPQCTDPDGFGWD